MPRLAALLVTLVLLGSVTPGQQAREAASSASGAAHGSDQSPLPAQQLARLSANADLVLVPVIVTNKSGEHVFGLQKDAFRIEENGKVRSVSLFDEVKAAKLITASKRNPNGGYSNFVSGEEPVWRVTAVVLDMLNTPWMRQLEAKQRLIDYLLRSAARDEPMAIFGLNSSGVHQLHPFTTDSKVLLAALKALRLSLSSEEQTQPPEAFNNDPNEQQQVWDETQLMSDFMQELSDTVAANYQRVATRETLLGMTQLAHAFQGIPGRKTIIWVSAGFPFMLDDPRSFARQGDDLTPEYEQAWRALNAADIAVDTVDLNTLDFSTKALPSANSGISSTQVNNIRGTNGVRSAMKLPYDKDAQQRLTLHAFADATGGRSCVTVEELDTCFAEAIEDSRSYYLLGYYLGGDNQPGWRKLKVKVAGDGLRVRYRSGFYVTARAEDSPELRRQQLLDAIASPVQYTGVRLNVRQVEARQVQASQVQASSEPPAPAASTKKTAEFMLEVMGDSITLAGPNRNGIDLEVLTVALNDHRASMGSNLQAVATEVKPESLQRIQRTGFGIPEKFDLPSGKYEVRFAVRDNPSGLVGTVSVPIQVK